MKKTAFEKALPKFNELIGSYYTLDAVIQEGDRRKKSWTLRDLVAEMDYCLSRYYEPGNACFEDWEYDSEGCKRAVAKMNRFIRHWLPECKGTACHGRHSSIYDNPSQITFVSHHLQ